MRNNNKKKKSKKAGGNEGVKNNKEKYLCITNKHRSKDMRIEIKKKIRIKRKCYREQLFEKNVKNVKGKKRNRLVSGES